MNRFTVLIAALLLSLTSWALDLNSAKAQGLVGEQTNGYLGLISTGNTAAAALVADINQQRRQKYLEIAAEQKTSLSSIETIAGDKLTQKAAAAGQYYQTSRGNWAR